MVRPDSLPDSAAYRKAQVFCCQYDSNHSALARPTKDSFGAERGSGQPLSRSPPSRNPSGPADLHIAGLIGYHSIQASRNHPGRDLLPHCRPRRLASVRLPELSSSRVSSGPVDRRAIPDIRERANSGRSAAWLAHLVWDQRVAGSNPAAPTFQIPAASCSGRTRFVQRPAWVLHFNSRRESDILFGLPRCPTGGPLRPEIP